MSRTIKFKVWEIGEKRFVDYYSISEDVVHVAIGDQYYLCNHLKSSDKTKAYLAEHNLPIRDQFVLCQFINAYDKDGKEVYENDILQSPSGKRFLVKWHDEEMRWAMFCYDTWYNIEVISHMVVGNRFEHPNMLA